MSRQTRLTVQYLRKKGAAYRAKAFGAKDQEIKLVRRQKT
jgi:hypothetical protein